MRNGLKKEPDNQPLPRAVRYAAVFMYATCIPVLIGLIYYGILSSWKRNLLEEQRSEWRNMAHTCASALDQQQRFDAKKQTLEELGGWHNARIVWNEVLTALETQMPTDISILTVRGQGELQSLSPPQGDQLHTRPRIGREHTLQASFIGGAGWDEARIPGILRSLRTAHGISRYFPSVNIGGVVKDSRDDELENAGPAAGKIVDFYASGGIRMINP